MSFKSEFLNELLQEEVYIEQLKGFINHLYSDNVYKLKNALYRLKQATHAWYGRDNLLRASMENNKKKEK